MEGDDGGGGDDDDDDNDAATDAPVSGGNSEAIAALPPPPSSPIEKPAPTVLPPPPAAPVAAPPRLLPPSPPPAPPSVSVPVTDDMDDILFQPPAQPPAQPPVAPPPPPPLPPMASASSYGEMAAGDSGIATDGFAAHEGPKHGDDPTDLDLVTGSGRGGGDDAQVALGADGEPAVGDDELFEDDEVIAAVIAVATHGIHNHRSQRFAMRAAGTWSRESSATSSRASERACRRFHLLSERREL
jgi:hypothetical protein